jgi:AcrR family transcriptional regulator
VSNSQTSVRTVTTRDGDGNGRGVGARAVPAAPRTSPAGGRTRQDPRTRILAAMVELVGEQGYASTTVADVIARAGASRRTFYVHFANMQACLLTGSDEITARWLARTASAVDQAAGAGGDAIEAFVVELFEATLASPGELRLLATELPAAARSGIERRERVFAELSGTLGRALAESPASGPQIRNGLDTPAGSLATRALVGAIVRIPYTRALRGGRMRRPARGPLLALAADVADWAANYRSAAPALAPADGPPAIGGRAPGTLTLSPGAARRRGLPRGESAVSHSFVVHNQRERLLDAVANLSAAKGYGAVTIPEIVHEAAVSVEAFYEHFSGREDALLVAYEVGRRKTLAVVELAYQAQEEWPAAVRGGIGALLTFLASEPSFTHLALIDVPAAGGKLAAVHEGAVVAMLREGLDLCPSARRPAQAAVEASASAVRELCYLYAASGRTRELPSLIEVATHIALAPFAAAGVPGC